MPTPDTPAELYLTFKVRFLWLTGAAPRSAAKLWPGTERTRDRTVVSVAFWAAGSFLPTLCLTFLKSIPTPLFFFLFFPLLGIAIPIGDSYYIWAAVADRVTIPRYCMDKLIYESCNLHETCITVIYFRNSASVD